MAVLLGIVLLPLAEIAAVIFVAQWISIWPTLLALALGSVLGAYILRKQGLTKGFAKEIRGVMNPLSVVAHRTLITLAGLLLFIPGFITGIFGLVLLVRPVRVLFLAWLTKRLTERQKRKEAADPTIDGEFVVVEPARIGEKTDD